MEQIYEVDDWLRLKGQSDRECVHVIQVHTAKCSKGMQYAYEVRLVVFNSYNNLGSRSRFMVNEIEVDRKIEKPKSE